MLPPRFLSCTSQELELSKELVEYFKDDFPVKKGRVKSEMVESLEGIIELGTKMLLQQRLMICVVPPMPN